MTDTDDDLDLDLDLADDVPPPAKKPNNLLIIIIAAVILVVVVGGALFFFMSGDEQASVDEPTTKVETKPQAIYVPLEEDFMIGIDDADGKKHHFSVKVSIMTRDEKLPEMIKKHKPLLVSNLVTLFNNQNYESLRTSQGKDQLRQQTRERVGKVVKEQHGEDTVEAVLFTKFIMD